MCPRLEGLAGCWGSVGSAMGKQGESLGQRVVRGTISPTHIIRMSGLIFWASDAPHFLLMVQKCKVHPSSGTDTQVRCKLWADWAQVEEGQGGPEHSLVLLARNG